MKKNIFLYHIIYIVFFTPSFSQNLHLKIKGTDSISTAFLKKINPQKSFKNLKLLKTEVQNTKTTTRNNGYFNAFFSALEKTSDSTYQIAVTLNQRFNKITVSYNNNYISKKELNKILPKETPLTSESFTLNTNELESNIYDIIRHLTNKGKTFSYTRLTNIQISDNIVYANLNLSTSKTNRITQIKIKGYKQFPKKFITHQIKLKKHQTLNPEEIEKKSNTINNLRFARELKKPEILFSKDSTIVYLYLKKHKSNIFDGFLGFSSNKETNKIEFNGNINLQLINNLNSGEELHLKYQSTENDQKKINIKTNVPYIFNTPFSIEGEFDIFKKDSSFTNNFQSIKTNYLLSKNIRIGGGLLFNNSNTLNEESTTLKDYKKNTYLLSFEHSVPNSTNLLFLNKTKTLLELSSSKRKTITNKTNQQQVYLSTEYTFDLNTKNAIFIKNESYYLISDDILENEMHYIGGINSIRGFQENSIPSAQYSTFNTEYRITLTQTLYTHTVLDYTITKNQVTNNFDNLIGLGIGFGLKTKSNLLRFIFANSKSENDNFKFSNSKIHLSLSTTF